MLSLDCQNDRVPWPDRILNGFDDTFVGTPRKFIANYGQFPLAHVIGEFGKENPSLPSPNGPALEQIQPRQFLRGLNPGMEPSATCGEKAMAPQFQFHRWAHAVDERNERFLKKIEWRRHRVVRSAFQGERAMAGGG